MVSCCIHHLEKHDFPTPFPSTANSSVLLRVTETKCLKVWTRTKFRVPSCGGQAETFV